MRTRLAVFTLLAAVAAACFGVARSGTAAAAQLGSHADISRILFRLPGNVVVCGLGRPSTRWLVCFRPAGGATVRMGRHGVPLAGVVKQNRGVPAGAAGAPILRKGHVYKGSVYRCTLKKVDVRCTNPAKHGFEMGKVEVFRW